MRDHSPERNHIANTTFDALYPVIRSVAKGELHRPTGITQIAEQFGINRNSARDFIDNFRKMLKGEKYQRRNTIYQTDLYLRMIRRDFGEDALRNALAAVKEHLAYYEQVPQGTSQPQIQKILDRYSQAVVNGPRQAGIELARQAKELSEAGEFDPDDEEDGRRRALRSIALREGEPEFRKRLMSHYRARCAITGCRVEEVLEAAHIRPYRGTKTNHSTNGILLRSDLHTLFDRHLITVDRSTMRVLVSPELEGSVYARLAGRRLRLPKERAKRSNRKALDRHRQASGL